MLSKRGSLINIDSLPIISLFSFPLTTAAITTIKNFPQLQSMVVEECVYQDEKNIEIYQNQIGG